MQRCLGLQRYSGLYYREYFKHCLGSQRYGDSLHMCNCKRCLGLQRYGGSHCMVVSAAWDHNGIVAHLLTSSKILASLNKLLQIANDGSETCDSIKIRFQSRG